MEKEYRQTAQILDSLEIFRFVLIIRYGHTFAIHCFEARIQYKKVKQYPGYANFYLFTILWDVCQLKFHKNFSAKFEVKTALIIKTGLLILVIMMKRRQNYGTEKRDC